LDGTKTLEVISGSYGLVFTWRSSVNLRRDARQDLVALAKLAISRLSTASSAGGDSSVPATASSVGTEQARRSSLTGLLMLMLAFPSELFNRTLKAHYRTVQGWLGPWERLDRKVMATIRSQPQWAGFSAFMVIGALLAALLDPTLGLNMGSLALVLGLVVSRAVVTVAFALPEMIFMRRRHRLRGQVEMLPAALALAAACVLVSRLAHFQPGYLYGVIVGIGFARKLSREDEGRVAAWAAGWVLVVSLAAWFAWTPVVNRISGGDTSFPILFVDAVLATTFVIGIETLVIGLLPMQVLHGRALFDWSRRVWGVLYALCGFVFVWVLIHPASDFVGTTHESGQVGRAMVPFVVFGAISVGFWLSLRKRAPSPLELEPVAPAPIGADGPNAPR
jgi:hypothetical protein